jgi:hypothetical protein
VDKQQILERERRFARPVAVVTLVAVVLSFVALYIVASKYGASDNAERLRKIDDDSGTFVLAYVIQAIGFALLSIPLLYLFRASRARSDRVRGQFVGMTIAGPLFLAVGSILTALLLKDAAPDFVAKGVMGTGDHANNIAEDVIKASSLADVTTGVGFAGAIAFAFTMAYTCFQAMRVGLLTRFWGSLGAALGVASFVFSQYTPLWFLYLGLLLAGLTRRGLPPAWAAGEAMPWPTPGERAAESLRGEDGDVIDGDAIDGTATEVDEPDANADADEIGTTGDPDKPRKRKRRRT